MALIADIVMAVTSSPAPVLFLDTCILLDVVRATLRNRPDEVKFAGIFLSAARKSPKTIHLFIGSPVPTEWGNHIRGTEDECTTAVNACNAVSAICPHLGLPTVPVLPPAVHNMPAMLRRLSADLLAACIRIDHDSAALGRAVDRIILNTHPVKQNSSKGAKDSVILEHAVETAARLRAAGFRDLCLFVSSNTSDFADPRSTNLHKELVPVFTPVNLVYAASLTDAESILSAAGWVP